MNTVLVAVDGSESALRAVQHLTRKRAKYADPEGLQIHLVNVQYPFSGDVGAFVDHETMRQYHQEEGLKQLAEARRQLDEAGVRYSFHVLVGDPAEVIAQFAREHHCDQIIMGTRGLGSVAGLLMGSVSTKVLHLADVPVLLVK